MDWETVLKEYSMMVEEKVGETLSKTIKEAEDYHPFVKDAYSFLSEFTLRKGKRLASCSTLATYKGYVGTIDEKILNVCAGIEIYRQSILIHDDLIDKEETRRGGKTIHRIFTDLFDERLGDGVAVFLGNIAYSLAVQTVIDSGFPREKIAETLLLLSEGYREVNESQMLDLLFEYRDVDAEEWHVMASKRAASLFKVTMLTGGVLGDASEKDLRLLREAAVNIGYAFDIQDDIIDTYASEEDYGRPACGDIRLGKKPLHIIYALGSPDSEVFFFLKSLRGRMSLSREEVEKIRSLVRLSGGLEKAKKASKMHAEEARRLIAETGLSSEAKGFFNSMIAYVENSLNWYR
ncbi:MAG: polyprenyl synthetase family protein [Crenarchaeota archaeon]|nr:polyprenyl synthetase family protein [Thermoproteota archaeon]